MTTIHESRPFNLRYIVRAPAGIHGDALRATHRTAMCNYLYITRQNGEDEFGPTPDFAARRADLVAVGRALIVDPDWVEKVRDARFDELRDFDRSALATLV